MDNSGPYLQILKLVEKVGGIYTETIAYPFDGEFGFKAVVEYFDMGKGETQRLIARQRYPYDLASYPHCSINRPFLIIDQVRIAMVKELWKEGL